MIRRLVCYPLCLQAGATIQVNQQQNPMLAVELASDGGGGCQ
jgi:hypothetical protein